MSTILVPGQLVTVCDDGEPRVSSRVVARGMGQQHASVMRLVRDNASDLQDFGFLDFKSEKGARGRPSEQAMLNEQQAAFLISLMRNNDEVRAFKKALIREFYRMRDALARRDIGAMRRYFEAELRDKESKAKASFGSSLMLERKREKPELQADIDKLLSAMQPSLLVN